MNGLKKAPNILSTEDLLLLAEKEITKEESIDLSEYKNDLLEFLHKLQIEPGEFKVHKNTLYLIYKAWSQEPLEKKCFSREVVNLLPVDGTDKWVMINKNSIKLTHEAYLKFKKESQVLKSARFAERFSDFLKYHAIEPGDYYIELDFLFHIYERHVEQKGILSPLSKLSFEKFCRVHFLSKQLATGPAFAVKSNIENFFEKGELKKLRRNHGKKKKRKSKKQARSSKPKSKV